MNEKESMEYEAEQASSNIAQQNMPYAAGMFEQHQQQQAILVAQTDPKRIIKDIIFRLQGIEEMDDGQRVQIAEPMLNKEGIENIRFLLHSHINDNVRLSRLEASDIANRMKILGDDLVISLALNYHKWGIKKETHRDDINNAVLCNIFDVLKRAEGQNEKNWLGKISVESIAGGNKPPGNKGGWLDKLKL